jgi:hypothetical protein
MKDIAQDGVIKIKGKAPETKKEEKNPDSHACQKAMEKVF